MMRKRRPKQQRRQQRKQRSFIRTRKVRLMGRQRSQDGNERLKQRIMMIMLKVTLLIQRSPRSKQSAPSEG